MNFIWGLIIYKFVLEASYVFGISPVFDYAGSYLQFNFINYIISWIVFFIVVVPYLKLFKEGILKKIIFIMILLFFIPNISLYGLKNITNEAILLNILYFIVFIVWMFLLNKIKINRNLKIEKKQSKFLFVCISIFIASSLIFIWGKYTGFDIYLTLDTEILRDVRLSSREISMPTVFSYLLPLSLTIFLPVLGLIAYYKKNYKLQMMTFVLVIIGFSIKGMKSWLFYYFVAIAISMLMKRKNFYSILTYIVITIVGVSLSVYLLTGSIELLGIMVHRSIVLPAELSFEYYNFFSENARLYLSESILSGVIDSPHSKTSGFIIGNIISGGASSQNNAVNGLFGDAYSNFGFIGIVIYPLLISIIYKIFEFFSNGIDQTIVMPMAFILVWNSLNTSLFTWLLTGGVIFIYIIFLCVKSFLHNKNCIILEVANE